MSTTVSAQIHPSPIKPPYHLYMQGSCKHGKRGSNCIFHHPPMCFNFLEKGSKRCDKGSLCTYAHPTLCQASFSNRRRDINICHFYHVSASLRPNHLGTPLEKRSDNKALPHKNPILPLQPYTNLALMFLGQLRDMKHQMSQMKQAQNLMLLNLMNNIWPMLPGQKTYHPTTLYLPN